MQYEHANGDADLVATPLVSAVARCRSSPSSGGTPPYLRLLISEIACSSLSGSARLRV